MRSPFPGMDPYLEHSDLWPDVHHGLTVDLNALLHELYDRAGYDLSIDYAAEPVPPFAGEVADWVAGCIAVQREVQ